MLPITFVTQSLVSTLYLIPFLGIGAIAPFVFFVIILMSKAAVNVVAPAKSNWFLSLVDDRSRGNFQAKINIVSLAGGVVFTFLASLTIDNFEAKGDLNGAFLVLTVVICILAVLQIACLIVAREKPVDKVKGESPFKAIRSLCKNKIYVRILIFNAIWALASNITTPFLSTYQIKELGFSMVFISLLTVLYSVSRALISRPLGRYADKTSFLNMLNVCYLFMAAAFAVNIFTTPENGRIMFSLYYLLYALGCAGITNSEINLVYESVDHEHRMGALALKSTISGLAGFAASLLVSPLVDYIQRNGNRFLGMQVYAQQVLSAITLSIALILLVYLNTVMRKKN